MPSLLEHLAARVALIHARRVFGSFERALKQPAEVQARALRLALAVVADSAYGRTLELAKIRTPEEFRRHVPLAGYEDLRPYIERVAAGETGALFSPGRRVLMFATSSGTTSAPKLIPVTGEFVREYRRGWNIFGLKMLTDHPDAMMRAILQVSGRMDERRTAAGIPCGAITGLLAQTQKRIVRRFYVGTPAIAQLEDPHARYYALMRLAVLRDVSFAVTANPATLIRLAQTADEECETFIRDVHDGTLSTRHVPPRRLAAELMRGVRPAPGRARELEALKARHGRLRPCDYWRLAFVACWTGGTMSLYRQRLADWYGPIPVRDVGLLASEGRVSIPLRDETAAGVLDVPGAFFEFIPMETWHLPSPPTLLCEHLQEGREYAVVLTNTAGLVRYRLDDVIAVRGWHAATPVVEFLYRAGGISSLAGEKLTESQVVAAVRSAAQKLGMAEFDYLLAPRWGDPPFYILVCGVEAPEGLAVAVDEALCCENEEYASRRKSMRLNNLRAESVPRTAFSRLDRWLLDSRGGTAEQYKRTILIPHALAENCLRILTDPARSDTE